MGVFPRVSKWGMEDSVPYPRQSPISIPITPFLLARSISEGHDPANGVAEADPAPGAPPSLAIVSCENDPLHLGGVDVEGSGFIFVNGKPPPLGPWGSFREVLMLMAAPSTVDLIAEPAERIDARKSALAKIVAVASIAIEELTGLEYPPPPERKLDKPNR